MKNSDPKQMKVVFIGRRWSFNTGIVQWLAENYTLCGVFYIEEESSSLKWRIDQIRQRIKKGGLLRACDEIVFRAFYHLVYGRQEHRMWASRMPERFKSISDSKKPTHSCDDIHAEHWLSTLRDLDPDIVFTVCVRTIFRPQLFKVPRLGSFVLHEGITPEYRGLDTTAWALLRGQQEYVGYTLLKVDEGIDSGPILCQGTYPDAVTLGFHCSLVGHMALLHGLPEIKNTLDDLYRKSGNFTEVSKVGRISRNHSWVPMSSYLRLRWKQWTTSMKR